MPSARATHQSSQTEGASPYLLWVIWVFWLFFLWQPLAALLAPPLTVSKVLSLCGMAVFIGIYLWITWQEAFRLTRETPMAIDATWQTWAPIAILLGLSIVMTLSEGQAALGSLIYVSASLCGRLTAWRAAAAVVGLTLLAVLLGAATNSPLSATGQIFFIIPAVGSLVYFFSRAIRVNQELRLARQEIARLAVSEERLRFARDLHDLLGHTLSLITLKSELARRLVSASPEQAAIELGDIESAARQALTEVREAVADYRQPTLASELRAARELLTAAGVTCTQRGQPEPLSASAEAALSWAVREGVTNVIRHSHARSCVISLTQREGRVGVEVRDDGAANPVATGATRGNGLAGLKERVVALGGACEAGPAPQGGFRLAVSLPVGADATPEGRGEGEQAVADPQMAEGGERRLRAWFG